MKLFKAIAATACALALASAAQATEYTDSSANYPGGEEGPSWDSGANGGTGFGAWTIDVSNGSEGWAGFGIWNPEANDFQGSWEGKTQAFGLMGKGAGFGVVASRSFRAALDYETGDSFSFDMAVNWDSNAEGSKKGFVLTAKGTPVLTVNHGAYPGHIYINDDDSDEVLNATADDGKPYPISWSFTAKDATTITVKANSRADGTTAYEKDWTVSTSAIDGFILQSVDQYNEDEDRRQSYYDNFKLEIAGELPELCTLEFTAGEWSVASPSQTLSYTLKRSIVSGTLDVDVTSSDSSFVAGKMVTFAGDEAEVSFTLDATLTGSDNYAKLTASADGCDPATYEVRGPVYSCNASDEGVEDPWNVGIGTERTLWVNNGKTQEQFPADDALITVESSDNGVVEVSTLAEWAVGDDGKSYTSCKITGIASGSATVSVLYGGVKMSDYGFTVPAPIEPGFTISGPTTAVAGKPYTYTLSVVTPNTSEPAVITVTGDASVTPESIDDVYPGTPEPLSVTFNTPGDFTLSVATPEGELAFELPVTVTEAPDYSKYIAYDDASFYADGFDTAALGEGTEKFQAWKILQDDNNPDGGIYCGSYIDSEGKFPSALYSDGTAFGLYANGSESANYVLYRPFVHSLAPGQTFSADWAPSTGDYGSRYFRLVREWDNNQYARFELYSGSGYLGYNLAGITSEGTDLGWEPANRVVHIELALSADGGTYSIALSDDQGNEWSTSFPSSTGEWGDGIQGVVIGTWNSPNDSGFNKLAIEQVVAPKAKIWLSGNNNPDGPGDIVFTLGANTAEIGVVALAVSEGASVSPESIDLTGLTEATFTVTLETAEPGSKFTVTATPEDTTVDPYSFDIYPIASSLELKSKDDRWLFNVADEEIWLYVKATPSKFGTYTLQTSDSSVLELSVATVTVDASSENGEAWFRVFIKGEGKDIIISLAEDPEKKWGFTITGKPVFADSDFGFVAAKELDVLPPFTVIPGRGLAWKVEELGDATLLGSVSLTEKVFPDDWKVLENEKDYVIEEDKLIVLFGE